MRQSDQTEDMPRVYPDQQKKFESDEMFKKLSQDSDVRLVVALRSSSDVYFSAQFASMLRILYVIM